MQPAEVDDEDWDIVDILEGFDREYDVEAADGDTTDIIISDGTTEVCCSSRIA